MLFDLLIVGGGVNGCAIARDAAGRGLSVMLVEKSDLASGTSSASTKLIHGGLRYLELYEFRLVQEALAERELLLASAPHIIWPLKFVLPHEPSLRPAWLIRLGLFLYDHLARRQRLEGSHMVRLRGAPYGAPLQESYQTGFTYADCWVDDSRLVVLNALDAHERGADIRVATRFAGASRHGDRWAARLETATGSEEIEAKALVDAAGPWVSEVLTGELHLGSRKHVRLVKGSHIVTRRLFEGDHAYILQNPDKRIVFAIPYEHDFTLIGTTDVPYSGPPGPVSIDEDEIGYLLASVNRCFRRSVRRADIVWSYAGLRPLHDDGSLEASVVTRDYAFDLDAGEGRAPILSIFGGKITTARRLAEHALEELAPFLPRQGPSFTGVSPLPGGDMPDFDAFLAELKMRKPFLESRVALRLARAYGTRTHQILGDSASMADLGRDFGFGLTDAELSYLMRREWARSAEDILWRRSKLGLHLDLTQQDAVREALRARAGDTPAPNS